MISAAMPYTKHFQEVDGKKLTASLTRVPALGNVPYPVVMEPNLVVEFYSR